VILAVVALFSSCDFVFDTSSPEELLPFSIHEGYSVKRGLAEGTHFFAFHDKTGFDEVLYWISDHNPHQPIPETYFATKIIIAVVKKGNRYWQMTVRRVTFRERIVTVDYAARVVAEDMSWTAAIPLVASIPIVDYESIAFIENGVPGQAIPR
jgi:hypothetical protein